LFKEWSEGPAIRSTIEAAGEKKSRGKWSTRRNKAKAGKEKTTWCSVLGGHGMNGWKKPICRASSRRRGRRGNKTEEPICLRNMVGGGLHLRLRKNFLIRTSQKIGENPFLGGVLGQLKKGGGFSWGWGGGKNLGWVTVQTKKRGRWRLKKRVAVRG